MVGGLEPSSRGPLSCVTHPEQRVRSGGGAGERDAHVHEDVLDLLEEIQDGISVEEIQDGIDAEMELKNRNRHRNINNNSKHDDDASARNKDGHIVNMCRKKGHNHP